LKDAKALLDELNVFTRMGKRNEKPAAGSASLQRLGTPQAPKTEIDFESLIATGIVAVVIKPAKKRRRPKPGPRA
jgi:hypothetical protein